MSSLDHEAEYWGNCCNTYCEETKQFVYARLMGLDVKGYKYNLGSKSVLDIGGGPSSLLLKAEGLSLGLVVDPLAYPAWTMDRYVSKGIMVSRSEGESLRVNNHNQLVVPDLNQSFSIFDEVWIYNCLQHVVDPELILFNARRSAKILRIAEWVDCPPDEMHPWVLNEKDLRKWLDTSWGNTVELNEDNCWGKMFYATLEYS